MEWELSWSEEFSGNGKPDPINWNFAKRATPNWACYCADNDSTIIVKEGLLHLRGILSDIKTDTSRYQTGCITTKGKFSFKYGKIEVRAKLSKGQGSWPAIWLMPKNNIYGGWPKSGEIDIMEYLNYDSIFYQTVHTDYTHNKKQKDNPKHYATVPFNAEHFNIFGLEWYPDRLDFFLNNHKTFTYPRLEGKGSSQWPFNDEYYIILDQALGGDWAGPIYSNDLPVEMVIDWIRVYKKNEGHAH